MLQEEIVASEDRGRNYDIGIYGPVGKLEFAGERFAPTLGFSARILISDKDCCVNFFEEFFKRIIGMTTKDEAYPPPPCVSLDVAKALLHEVIMPEVCVGVIGDDGEEDYDGKAEQVSNIDCDVKGGVVVNAHRALHPVDNGFAVGKRRTVAADEYSRISGELGECLRESRAVHCSSYFPRLDGRAAQAGCTT